MTTKRRGLRAAPFPFRMLPPTPQTSAKMNPSARQPSLNIVVSSPPSPKPKPALTKQQLRTVLPAVWELMRPRRGLLALGFLLMVVNRVSGLVLPYSTKFLIDSVIAKHRVELLRRLVLVVLSATSSRESLLFRLHNCCRRQRSA